MRGDSIGRCILSLLVFAGTAVPDTPQIAKNTKPRSRLLAPTDRSLWRSIDARTDIPKTIIYFPTLVEGTSVIYNLPGLEDSVCLSGETLAGIFSGQITVWNDRHILATNPRLKLPSERIRLLNRADENGMNWLLTRYLTHASKAWAATRGTSASPVWPTGIAATSEQEMIDKVLGTRYALGFSAFYSARAKSAPTAAIRNRAGTCEVPSLRSLTLASLSIARHLHIDSNMDAVDSNDSGAYPITGFSGLIIPAYKDPDNQAREITGLVRYILTDGQKLAWESGYVGLPFSLVEFELQALDLIDPH